MVDQGITKYKESKEYKRVYSLLIQAAQFRGTVQYMHVAKIIAVEH